MQGSEADGRPARLRPIRTTAFLVGATAVAYFASAFVARALDGPRPEAEAARSFVTLLQLFGASHAVVSLRRRQRTHGIDLVAGFLREAEELNEAAFGWVDRLVGFLALLIPNPPRDVVVVLPDPATMRLEARAPIVWNTEADETLEARVARLEKGIVDLKSALNGEVKEWRANLEAATTATENLRRESERKWSAHTAADEDAALGTLNVEWAGIALIASGTLLSPWAERISGWWDWIVY